MRRKAKKDGRWRSEGVSVGREWKGWLFIVLFCCPNFTIYMINKKRQKKKKFSETDGKKKHTYTHINRGET